jgi:hypothetical protein
MFGSTNNASSSLSPSPLGSKAANPTNRSVPFRHKHPASGDLRERQFDGIRMGQQSVTITCVGKGRPQLQVLKLLLFGGNRLANHKIPHCTLSYTGKNELGRFDGWQAGVVIRICGGPEIRSR